MTAPAPGPSDTLAIAAFIVSIAGATITLFGLTWQLVLYRLSGARLKVTLVFGYVGANGNSVRYPTTRASRKPPSWSDNISKHASELGVEFAEVRVTNIGRTAVSVEDVSLDLGRSSWRSRRRNSITPRLFYDPRKLTNSDGRAIDLLSPIRLETGANVIVAFNLWPVMTDHELGAAAGTVKLRGSATAAGRRATRSKLRHAWKLRKGATSRFSDRPTTPELNVFRELWNNAYDDGVGPDLLVHHEEILRRLTAGDDPAELSKYVMELVAPERAFVASMVAFKVHGIYHRNTTSPSGHAEIE